MMAISTFDQLVAAMTAGQKKDIYKASATAEGAGTWHSLWLAAGQPVAGVAQGSLAGAVPTKDTTGAIKFTNPASGNSHILHAIMSGSTLGKVIVYDRLWHNSGMSGTVVTDTSLGASATVNRPDGGGAGVEMWGEIYTAIGATAATLTVHYIDQDGNTDQVATYAHPANAETVGQMFPLMLASGDTGVRRPDSYFWSVTTGTAGSFGLTLLRRVAEIPIQQINVGMLLDFAMMGAPQVYNDACLALMVLCSATNTGIIQGSVRIGQG